MSWLALLFVPAAAYQILTIAAVARHTRRKRREALQTAQPSFLPRVSVLKPLRGLDPNTYPAFVSQVQQSYPDFEILFGVRDESDPCIALVDQLRRVFPAASIQLIVSAQITPNGKVGVLSALSQYATGSIWVVNDSDIEVTSDYLRSVVAPLADPSVAIVTCPYRVHGHTAAASWEALGVATSFIPSTMVAQLLGVREFGLGSTLAFRANDLRKSGGFEALSQYLADDYHLAKQLCSSGARALLSTYAVETSLSDATWSGIWRHQIRWARTIRVSQGPGYAGLFITHAGVWAVAAAAVGMWTAAAALFVLRATSAWFVSWAALRDPGTARRFWLAPFWDLYAFCVWLTSYAGRQVHWRDQVLSIGPDGRIQAVRQA